MVPGDTGVYVVSGVFAIAVFLIAVYSAMRWGTITLNQRAVLTFSVGFLVFMAVYFTAMAVYYGIDN